MWRHSLPPLERAGRRWAGSVAGVAAAFAAATSALVVLHALSPLYLSDTDYGLRDQLTVRKQQGRFRPVSRPADRPSATGHRSPTPTARTPRSPAPRYPPAPAKPHAAHKSLPRGASCATTRPSNAP